jgi:predicted TIM-barrel fold metal-dependent hydrolase
MVIDFHTHVLPSGLARLAEVMRENGLALAVNLSGGSQGRGLEVSVAMAEAFPGIVSFYTPDWRLRGEPGFAEAEARKLEEAVRRHGFRGLKVSKALGLHLTLPDGVRMPVDWPGLDPLWAKAGELGVPVAIHTADPKAFWRPVTPENERFEELSLHPGWSYHGSGLPSQEELLAELERVFARHPRTTFVSVHFGNDAEDLAYVGRILDTYPNVFADTAARLGEIGRHPPDEVRRFFIRHRDRLVFGTDLGISADGLMLGSQGAEEPTMADVGPFFDAHWRFFEGKARGIAHPTPVQGRWTIDAIDLPDDVLDALYYKNAERLLGLAPAGPDGPPLPRKP